VPARAPAALHCPFPAHTAMNAIEHFVCSSSLWRYVAQRHVLPWVLSGARLGDHVLDIGAGYGAATSDLRKRVRRVTSLECDTKSMQSLKSQLAAATDFLVQGDAAQLPFADQTFSSAVCILVLHHLKSRELQDQFFAEAFRVLRPGGVLLAAEIKDTWLHRAVHYKSTFTPLTPGSVFARLAAAGFSRISVDMRGGGFRLSASRAKEQPLISPTKEVTVPAGSQPDTLAPAHGDQPVATKVQGATASAGKGD
jgi:SAM-dependent methyltransferase